MADIREGQLSVGASDQHKDDHRLNFRVIDLLLL